MKIKQYFSKCRRFSNTDHATVLHRTNNAMAHEIRVGGTLQRSAAKHADDKG